MKYALVTLSASERALVYALYWERKSVAEFAKQTNTPVRTVTYRREAVLRKLRRFMDVQEGREGKKAVEIGYLADSNGAGACKG
jgi:DNA-directed RNA polymerase specialized sigma24 family protein